MTPRTYQQIPTGDLLTELLFRFTEARDDEVIQRLDAIEKNQTALLEQGKKIMAAIDDANAALATINTATNSLGAIAQTISTELNALIANAQPGSTITPEFLAAIQSQATQTAALVPVLQGIASAGAANPVPVPVPTPATGS